MILYLDTSALVKLYVEEVFSDQVIKQVGQAEISATSRIAYVEALSERLTPFTWLPRCCCGEKSKKTSGSLPSTNA